MGGNHRKCSISKMLNSPIRTISEYAKSPTISDAHCGVYDIRSRQQGQMKGITNISQHRALLFIGRTRSFYQTSTRTTRANLYFVGFLFQKMFEKAMYYGTALWIQRCSSLESCCSSRFDPDRTAHSCDQCKTRFNLPCQVSFPSYLTATKLNIECIKNVFYEDYPYNGDYAYDEELIHRSPILQMTEIHKLLKEIEGSEEFRAILKNSLADIQRQQRQYTQPASLPINALVDEINSYLGQISESVLQEDHNQLYLSFMKRNQELYQQQEKRFRCILEDRLTIFKQEIHELVYNIVKDSGSINEKVDKTAVLKHERRMITQSILQGSSLNLSINSRIKPESQQSENEKTIVNSSLIAPIQQKIADLQKEHQKELNSVVEELNHKIDWIGEALNQKIDSIGEELQKLTLNHVEHKLRFQEKIDIGFEGIWHVVGEIEGKLAKMQSTQNAPKLQKVKSLSNLALWKK